METDNRILRPTRLLPGMRKVLAVQEESRGLALLSKQVIERARRLE
jgi:hypothetical protein